MNTAKASGQQLEGRQKPSDLQHRYRDIAISAVVAALPYRSDSKNPAYAPAEPRD